MSRKVSDHDRAVIHRLYGEQGLTQVRIAERLGLSQSTVSATLASPQPVPSLPRVSSTSPSE